MAVKEVGRQLRQTIIVALGATVFARHVTALDIARFFQALPKEGQAQWIVQPPGRNTKEPDHRHRRLLRARRQRPCRRRAAEQRDELAASNHSITWSARASTVVGISRPSAFAVFRLTTNSYLFGACTGRSEGFSPLRTRSI